MLACQPSANSIYVFNNSQRVSPHGQVRKQYEIEEYKFEYKDIDKILGFSFVSSTYFNFFICTNKEIEILNFNNFCSNVVHVKKIQIYGEYLMYELQYYNFLTVVSETGHLTVVDLSKNPRTKTILKKSHRFGYDTNSEVEQPDQASRMSISNRFMSFLKSTTVEDAFVIKEPTNNKNLYLMSQKPDEISEVFDMRPSTPHSLHLALVYSVPHLFHLNSTTGCLDIYSFDVAARVFLRAQQSIELIPECAHALHVVDTGPGEGFTHAGPNAGVLLVHNIDAQFTKLFDFAVPPTQEPLCKNLPMNNRYAQEIAAGLAGEGDDNTLNHLGGFISDGIQAEYEVDYHSEEQENLESLITGSKHMPIPAQSLGVKTKFNYHQLLSADRYSHLHI